MYTHNYLVTTFISLSEIYFLSLNLFLYFSIVTSLILKTHSSYTSNVSKMKAEMCFRSGFLKCFSIFGWCIKQWQKINVNLSFLTRIVLLLWIIIWKQITIQYKCFYFQNNIRMISNGSDKNLWLWIDQKNLIVSMDGVPLKISPITYCKDRRNIYV